MNRILSILLIATLWLSAQSHTNNGTELLAYSSIDGKSGLMLAWRANNAQPWTQIGTSAFVNSDFGPWGSHKKMYAPVLIQTKDGDWQLTWIADPKDGVLATATSPDLLYWRPQTYAMATGEREGMCQYIVDGQPVIGTAIKVPRQIIETLINYAEKREAQDKLYAETMADDPVRFADLQPFAYTITADPKAAKAISDILIGIFIEDINYAADGGLYAELVQNRDFEYQRAEHPSDKKWNAMKAWKIVNSSAGNYVIDSVAPIHHNNLHYIKLTANEAGYGVTNGGFDGIAVKAGEGYDLSIMARGNAKLTISLVNDDDNVIASKQISVNKGDWTTYSAVLTPDQDAAKALLRISFDAPGQADLDMVSLFPQNTFKGRKNGLRSDLAQLLADMHPRFIRFPGGCVAHGDGIDNIYDWKGSVGPLHERKPLRNLWGYHQTRGLGYYEYFQLCEDIGAQPLPVLAAGVPCQNSGSASHHSHDAVTTLGQQCGIPMEEMDAYIQDILDLIEWANGPADSKWGSVRAAAGHPEPFGLKYIGIGNEDMITDAFEERFTMIYNAIAEKHPEIKVVGTVGPFYEGTDYTEGWRLARELNVPLVDEHYYVAPGWMIYNQDFYNNYPRGEKATKVYLGEYAAHLQDRPSNLETALAEALYLTSVERNADIVEMTSYAPLFSKDGRTQWRPDLIYFSNTETRPSVDYYVQMLYGQNSGTEYIPATATISIADEKAQKRVASSIVYDPATKEYVLKIANLLPVSVDFDANLTKLKVKKQEANGWQITGKPTDADLTPTPIAIAMQKSGKLQYTLPPYSFTVVRLKTNGKK